MPEGTNVTSPVTDRPPTRRQLAAQETRRKLLEAAVAHFGRRPYAEVTVADIARTAGVAHGLLSHHFNGKDNLFAEAVREIDRCLCDATRIEPDGPPLDRLRRYFTSHLRFLAEHKDVALNLILRRTDTADVATQAFDASRRRGLEAICDLLGLDADAPTLGMPLYGFAAAADETARVWLGGDPPCPLETMVDLWITFLAAAIQAAHDLEPAPALNDALELLRSAR